jgi:hypothetical protein
VVVSSSKPDTQQVAENFVKAAARLRRARVVDQQEYPKLVRRTFAGVLVIAESSYPRDRRYEGLAWAQNEVRTLIAKEVDQMERQDRESPKSAEIEMLMNRELDAAAELAKGRHYLKYRWTRGESRFGRLLTRITGGPEVELIPGAPALGEEVIINGQPVSFLVLGVSQPRENMFRRAHGVWHISYEDEKVSVPTSRGLEYIAQLLRAPGQSIPCIKLEELSTAKRPAFQSAPITDFGRQEIMDAKAKRQCETTAEELKKQIEDARDRGNMPRVEELTQELESIEQYLKASTGRGGKRRQFSDSSEKARLRVRGDVDRAIENLEKIAPKTAAHLRKNIKTGKSVVYQDQTTSWKIFP